MWIDANRGNTQRKLRHLCPQLSLNWYFTTVAINAKEWRKIVTMSYPKHSCMPGMMKKGSCSWKEWYMLLPRYIRNIWQQPKLVKNPVCDDTEGTPWNVEECFTVQSKIDISPWNSWLPDKSTQPICSQQNDEWLLNDNCVECGWPRNITQTSQGSKDCYLANKRLWRH